MRPRVVLTSVAAFAVLVAPATGALAKKAPPKKAPPKKTYCYLLLDTNPNDDSMKAAPVVSSPALSLKSGDVATGAKTMVVVLRLGSTNTVFPGDNWSVLEYTYAFNFESTLGTAYDFTAKADSSGTFTGAASVDGAGVPVDFKVLPDGHSIQWTIQRKGITQLAKPKNVFHNFSGNTNAFSSNADGASNGTSSYPDKSLSCVHAS